MKNRLFRSLLTAAALLGGSASVAGAASAAEEYPAPAQFESCEGLALQAECEYYEQYKKQTVLVVGVCLVGKVQAAKGPVERLYCEPYPESATN